MENVTNKRVKQLWLKLLVIVCSVSLAALCGCNSRSMPIKGESPCFVPVELGYNEAFSGISEIKDSTNFKIEVYVSILDEFGDSMKLPGSFRVELYERNRKTSQNNIGERLNINENGYVEFDLRSPENNQKYWDRITSSYSLNFTVNNAPRDLTAQVTWFYTEKYRLTTTVELAKAR